LIAEKSVVAGPLRKAVFESNLYRMPPNGIIFRDGEQGFKTLTDWARATGKETLNGRLVGFIADPLLILPDDLSELPKNPRQLRGMPFYKIHSDSPCINTGIAIEDNGGSDFFSNPVLPNHRPSLGVHEPPR
jgi:hypothetical protein